MNGTIIMEKLRIHQLGDGNVGDMLTQPIVEHILGVTTINVKHQESNKLLGVGSILSWAVMEGDVVWGSGNIADKPIKLPSCKILALRGKLSEKNTGVDCKVFGDPALLLPLIYNPRNIQKEHKLGIIEHYVDKGLYQNDGYRISVWQKWQNFVDEVIKCEKIVSSSLHGCIIAEAYGIPVEWVVLSDRVAGKGFKFRDHLSATNRTNFSESLDLKELKEIQNQLIKVLKDEYFTKNPC